MRATILIGILFGVLLVAFLSRGNDGTRPEGYPKRDLGNLWEVVEGDTVAAAGEVEHDLGLVAPLEVQRYGVYADEGSYGVELADARGEALYVVLAGHRPDLRTGYVSVGEHLSNVGSEAVLPGSERERAIATALVLATRGARSGNEVGAARRMASVLIGRKAR
ncbi:MAG: hypothetical protein R3E97_19810 [Candidatus Eisenbacteria bacterium]